jgi:glycosidase
VDNHDVTRVASILKNPEHLKLIYTLMFGMPGIPLIYYGSEWGFKADKSEGDPALRPEFEKPEWNDLTSHIAALAAAEKRSKALQYGDFKSLVLTNRQCVFERECGEGRVLVAINADENEYRADFNARAGRAKDLITGDTIDFGGGLRIPGYSGMILEPY